MKHKIAGSVIIVLAMSASLIMDAYFDAQDRFEIAQQQAVSNSNLAWLK